MIRLIAAALLSAPLLTLIPTASADDCNGLNFNDDPCVGFYYDNLGRWKCTGVYATDAGCFGVTYWCTGWTTPPALQNTAWCVGAAS